MGQVAEEGDAAAAAAAAAASAAVLLTWLELSLSDRGDDVVMMA